MNGPRTRATWVWNTADVVANATETNNFIAFAQKNQLNRVYVHIDQYVLPSDFRTFVYKCSRTGSGVAVEALIGDPQWILQINTASMASRLQWVQKYQASVGGNVDYQIKGLHLDIEPWALSGWATNQADIIQKWQDLVRSLKSWASVQSPPLPVAADLAFWLYTLTDKAKKRLDLSMLDILDSAVFMTYRNTPQALLDLAKPALQAAGECGGKDITLAVETLRNTEAPFVSYYGMGKQRLADDLTSISGVAIQWFGGLAVHDYRGWSAMH